MVSEPLFSNTGSWFKPSSRSNVCGDLIYHAVDIDTSKGLDITSFPIAEETLHAVGLHFLTQSPPAHDAPRLLGTLRQELTMALETRDKLAQSVSIVFDEISKTGAARPGPVKEAVRKITIVI